MRNLSVAHIADLHADYEKVKQQKFERSAEQFLGYCRTNPVDYAVIAGDVWEQLQDFQRGSGVEMMYRFLDILSTLVKYICITKGNGPDHDVSGSVALLHQRQKNILAYEYPVVLGFFEQGPIDLLRVNDIRKIKDEMPEPEIIIPLMPYPTKAALVGEGSIDQNNADFGALFDGLMQAFGLINSKFNCPKIMGFHGNVQGSRLSNGQSLLGQDIIISPYSLLKAACDYYALGHIHMWQQILDLPMYYSGSWFNKNHGEAEQKFFNIIKFAVEDDGHHEMNVKKILLEAARPMIKVVAEFKDGAFVYDSAGIPPNAELWFHYKINENDRHVLTDEKKNELKKLLPEDARIDGEMIPAERESRSEKIMEAGNLLDEVKEYAALTKHKMTKSIEKKVEMIGSNGQIEEEEEIVSSQQANEILNAAPVNFHLEELETT